jgi:hypothetical protein
MSETKLSASARSELDIATILAISIYLRLFQNVEMISNK